MVLIFQDVVSAGKSQNSKLAKSKTNPGKSPNGNHSVGGMTTRVEGGVSNLEKSKVYAGGQSLCLNSRFALSQKQELYSDLQPET